MDSAENVTFTQNDLLLFVILLSVPLFRRLFAVERLSVDPYPFLKKSFFSESEKICGFGLSGLF